MFRVLEYREPFAGGMSVGLNMFEQSRRGGWINDIDPGVYASWTAAKLFPDHLQASVWRSDPTVKAFNTLVSATRECPLRAKLECPLLGLAR